MPSLPEGWRGTKGASCAGWDIWAAFNLNEPEGRRFAIFRRRIALQDYYDKGQVFATASAMDQSLAAIRWQLQSGKYTFDDLFPDDVITRHPNYGAF